MIISLIKKGSIKAGVMSIPVFIASSLFMHFLFVVMLTKLFSGLVLRI